MALRIAYRRVHGLSTDGLFTKSPKDGRGRLGGHLPRGRRPRACLSLSLSLSLARSLLFALSRSLPPWRRHRGKCVLKHIPETPHTPCLFHPKLVQSSVFSSKALPVSVKAVSLSPNLLQLPLTTRLVSSRGGVGAWCLHAQEQGRRMQTLNPRPHTLNPDREQATSWFLPQGRPRSFIVAAQAQV